MFKIGNIVTMVSDSMDYRLNDPKLSLKFEGYAYGSEKKLKHTRLEIIDEFNNETKRDEDIVVSHYFVVKNLNSVFNEIFIVNETAVTELGTELTVAEIEDLVNIYPVVIDEGRGEDTINYPSVNSLEGKLVKLANGSVYYGTDTSLISQTAERPYLDYDSKLRNAENISFDIDAVYNVTNPKQFITLQPNEEAIEWMRPTILTLDEISKRVGYKIALKKEN